VIFARYGAFGHLDAQALLAIVIMLLVVGSLARVKPAWFLQPEDRTTKSELHRISSVGGKLLTWAVVLAVADIAWFSFATNLHW